MALYHNGLPLQNQLSLSSHEKDTRSILIKEYFHSTKCMTGNILQNNQGHLK